MTDAIPLLTGGPNFGSSAWWGSIDEVQQKLVDVMGGTEDFSTFVELISTHETWFIFLD